jgi:pimeloyl-ACP methyl ester carboxylesterase
LVASELCFVANQTQWEGENLMLLKKLWCLFVVMLGLVLTLAGCGGGGESFTYSSVGQKHLEGNLSSGGRYVIDVPANWNGKLYVYSIGFISAALPATSSPKNSPDDITKAWMLDNGYALAGSQPVGLGWAVAEIIPDQAELVRDIFPKLVHKPLRTVAWGNSMGGLITAGLIQRYPDLFSAAIPMCASVAGPIAMMNQSLDAAFAFKTLLAPTDSVIQLVDMGTTANETASTARAKQVLDQAQLTPQGRARIALASAFAQLSTWSTVGDSQPASTDWLAQETQNYKAVMFAVFSPRLPMEERAGGNISWNTGVNYRELLANSGRTAMVEALYQTAGLSLEADLNALANAPRISANAKAVDYMRSNLTPSGVVGGPVLTLHEVGDNAPVVAQAGRYSDVVASVASQRNLDLLRAAFVNRPGHCNYTAAERVTLTQAMEKRLESGAWGATATAASLNALAASLKAATTRDLGTANFADYLPGKMLRPDIASTNP